MRVPYKKIKGRLSWPAARKAAVEFLRRYSRTKGITRDEILTATLGEIVLRTDAIVGWLLYKKGPKTACISTHPVEEMDVLMKRVECQSKGEEWISLERYLEGVALHDNRRKQVRAKPFDQLEDFVHTRRSFGDEYERIGNLLVVDLSSLNEGICCVRLLVDTMDSNILEQISGGVDKFGGELRKKENKVKPWKSKRIGKKDVTFLGETSGAGMFADVEARKTIYPEETINQILKTIQNELDLNPCIESPYPVYFLWPNRYVAPSKLLEQDPPSWRHWPTRDQMEAMKEILGGDSKVEKFIRITWPKGTGICNRVSSTRMPYYSKGWQTDLIQTYREVEAEVTREKDVFQVPILWYGSLLAIAAVNASNLTLDQQRSVYELVLEKTEAIKQCAERDVQISGYLNDLIKLFRRRMMHEIHPQLLHFCCSTIDDLLYPEKGTGKKIKVDKTVLEQLSIAMNHQMESMTTTNWPDKKSFVKWRKGLSSIIDLEGSYFELRSLLKEACFIGESGEYSEKSPFNIDCSNETIFVHRSYLRMALVNLLHNAQDFAELTDEVQPCEKPIFVRGFKQDEWIVIEVEDNAGGMSPETEKKCFEYEYKEGHYAGLGIGLAFVEAVVQAHDGIVELKNNMGKGCIFKLMLPLHKKG